MSLVPHPFALMRAAIKFVLNVMIKLSGMNPVPKGILCINGRGVPKASNGFKNE